MVQDDTVDRGRRRVLRAGVTVAASVPVIATLRPMPALAVSPPPTEVDDDVEVDQPPGPDAPANGDGGNGDGGNGDGGNGDGGNGEGGNGIGGNGEGGNGIGGADVEVLGDRAEQPGPDVEVLGGRLEQQGPDVEVLGQRFELAESGADVATLLAMAGGSIAAGAGAVWWAGQHSTEAADDDADGEDTPPATAQA